MVYLRHGYLSQLAVIDLTSWPLFRRLCRLCRHLKSSGSRGTKGPQERPCLRTFQRGIVKPLLTGSPLQQHSSHDLATGPISASIHQSPFLRLPLEIRQMVYKEVLGTRVYKLRLQESYTVSRPDDISEPNIVYTNELFFFNHDKDKVRQGLPPHEWFALLQTCKTLYLDSIDYLYRSNVFAFDDLSTIRAFVRSCPKEHRQIIRRMAVDPRIANFTRLQKAKWDLLCRIIIEHFTGLHKMSISSRNMLRVNANWVTNVAFEELELPLLAFYRNIGMQLTRVAGVDLDRGEIHEYFHTSTGIPWQHFVLTKTRPELCRSAAQQDSLRAETAAPDPGASF